MDGDLGRLKKGSLLNCSIFGRLPRNQKPAPQLSHNPKRVQEGKSPMNGIIYLVGLVVVILAVLSFFGLR